MDTDYKVCSTACCQVYDPTKVTQVAIDATARIFYSSGGVVKTDIMMYKPSSTTYEYIWGAFFPVVVIMELFPIARSLH